MTRARLDTPFLDGGIRSTNFFNGRLLSREDMQREQDAARAAHERLGRALGAGIASGFEVEAVAIGGSSVADPVVTVRAGLAVNRRGQTVALDRDVDVSLVRPGTTSGTTSSSPGAGGFATCAPPENAVYVAGTGVYLLSVAPASQTQGLAVVSGLNNTASPCNAKERVAGIQFHLYQVKLTPTELADDAHLRNAVAYKFFAAGGATTDAVRDPFGVAAAPAALTDPALPDCDVPLAVFQWTAAGGLRWVDLWSVRRRLAGPDRDPAWLGAGPRDAALGVAMQLQFAAQIAELPRTGSPVLVVDSFAHLPPIGVLRLDAAFGVGFFSRRDPLGAAVPLTVRGPAFVEGARVKRLLEDGACYPPIDVAGNELIWLYLVRENRNPPPGAPTPLPYLIFASGQIPYAADARFNVAKWSFANLSLDTEPTGP
jgi:hypothetical protein